MAKITIRRPWAVETELPLGSDDWRLLNSFKTKEDAEAHIEMVEGKFSKGSVNLRARFAFVAKPNPNLQPTDPIGA